MARTISHLAWAERLEGWPDMIPKPRPRGIKALGRRYELAVAKRLPSAARSVWWSFRDANGPGLCQTDLLLAGGSWAVILECKHTWTEEGLDQLFGLYIPVVEAATSKRAVGVLVCKHMIPQFSTPVHLDLNSAVEEAKQFHPRYPITTLHWRGLGPILKPKTKELAYG